MKTPITIVSSILMLTLFTNCASSQFDKKPPFKVSKAKYQEWTGGKPGSKGILVTIQFANTPDDNIKFDSVFFNDKVVALSEDVIDDKKILNGNFINHSFTDKNIIMDADPKKEFGNKPPEPTGNFPFKLSENECVISYTINNKKHYFKLDNLQKGKAIIYP